MVSQGNPNLEPLFAIICHLGSSCGIVQGLPFVGVPRAVVVFRFLLGTCANSTIEAETSH